MSDSRKIVVLGANSFSGQDFVDLLLGDPRNDVIDHVFRYGSKEELPVTGDWNGDGVRNIGTFQDGTWKLDMDGDEGSDAIED